MEDQALRIAIRNQGQDHTLRTATDTRALILKDLGITEPQSFTQDVLITRYRDLWEDYRKAKGKERREIGKDIDRLVKLLALNKPAKKRKTIQDYVNKHNKSEATQ